MHHKLPLYSALSSVPMLKKSYIGKIMTIAFIGIHTPLLCIISYLITQSQLDSESAWHILFVTLIATLFGTAATLYILLGLLKPVSLASLALRSYLKDQSLPDLPASYEDEVGLLMHDVQHVIQDLQQTINELERISSTDSLTGVINRMCMEAKLKALSTHLSGSNTIYIAMIDLDKFKQINDQHGHQSGDLCLQHLVSVINKNIRNEDSLARWGGDEFLLMLANQDFESAKKTYQRLIDSLLNNPILLANGVSINLEASIGVAQCHQGFDVDESINQADRMLYKAKEGGGRQVLFSD